MRWLAVLCLVMSCQAQALTARSWLITDTDLNVQSGYNYRELRSIASLTKLLTVMVAIDDGTARPELVKLAMVNSNNHAATQLCKNYSRGYQACIRAMNEKAMRLDAWNTYLYDSTGLDRRNRSTAQDIARIVLAARNYAQIVESSHILRDRKKKMVLKNTNPLVGTFNTTVSKTGWTMAAGGCIAVLIENRIYVLLGSHNTKTRVTELAQLVRAEGVEPSKLGF